ncbi:probable rRNA-processing protein EFG1 at N-terminal half [Coccomyxa sp. Obi]|nr:probable rRNA-processing protein EFG1 at N-terminal half [Coccomyxa sp. Obi]
MDKRKLQLSKGGVKKKPVSLKNQIRGIERLLRKEGLDARVRKKEEAKLQELKLAIEEHKRAEKERIYAVRYHKIRFFERIKLERAIKRAEKQIAEASKKGDGAPTALMEHLACLQDDLQYVMHFPKGEKYVSILRNAEDPAAQAALMAERERLRALVHKQQADIAMLTEADEGAALLARQRRPTQQPTTLTNASATVPATAAEEASQEEDDFFTPDDSEGSASDGEQFHSVPRSSKADVAAPARHRPAEAPSTAQRGTQGRTAVSGVAEHRPGARDGAPSAAAPPALTAAEEDMAAEDDFFMQAGESEGDSDAASSEQDDDSRPGAPPVHHGLGGAAHRTDDAMAMGQPAEVQNAQKHAGFVGRREGSGAPGSYQHGGKRQSEKGGRQPAGGAHAKQAFAAERVAGRPHGPRKPAAEGQRPQLKDRAHSAAGAGKRRAAESAPAGKQPLRTRAEGGRKRRKNK